MMLSQYNGETGRLEIYSAATGCLVFKGVVKDTALGLKIENSIRKAEREMKKDANYKIQHLSIYDE